MPFVLLEKKRLYRRVATPRNDVGECLHIEARAPDQRAVHIGLTRQIANVFGLDAAPIDNPAELGRLRAEPLLQPLPDVPVRLGGLRGRRVATGADGPDRLVGGNELAELLGGGPRQPGSTLA